MSHYWTFQREALWHELSGLRKCLFVPLRLCHRGIPLLFLSFIAVNLVSVFHLPSGSYDQAKETACVPCLPPGICSCSYYVFLIVYDCFYVHHVTSESWQLT